VVGRDGRVGALEDLLLDLRRLVEQRLALGHLHHDLGLALERLDQPRVVAVTLVDRLDRGGRPQVAWIDLEHALVGRHRLLVLSQLGLVVLGEAGQERDLELLVADASRSPRRG
jgi:hypothetical protein